MHLPQIFRTPTGITWTGKGRVKKELLEYFNEQGETLADLNKYRVDAPKVESKPEPAPEVKKEPKAKEEPKDKPEERKSRLLFHK